MKVFLQTVLLTVAVATSALGSDLQRVLQDAQTAMIRGDIETARQNFQLAYQMDSRNAVAIGGLKQIAAMEKKTGPGAAVEKQYAALVIPQVQFKEASFGSALEALKKKVVETSAGKQSANFVVQPGVDQNAAITLSLTNVPFTEALRYMTELVNAKVEYQKYAIVIRPAGGVVSTSSPAPAPGQ